MNVRPWLLALIIPLLLVPVLEGQTPGVPSPSPCATAEHRQFDFWVGTWDVTTPDGKPAGTNRIDLVLNGCVLLENWEGAKGGAGKSFSLYEAATRQWTQTWVDASGSRVVLTGGREGEKMVLRNAWTSADGRKMRSDLTWTPLPDGKVRQTWRQSSDDGATYTVTFDGIYAKRS